MTAFGAGRTGHLLTLRRADLLRQLRRQRKRAAFRHEEARRERVVTEIRRTRLIGIRVAVPVEALEARLIGLPDGVTVEPDRIEVRFGGAQEAVGRLFALAQALANDYERFKALVSERGESAGGRRAGNGYMRSTRTTCLVAVGVMCCAVLSACAAKSQLDPTVMNDIAACTGGYSTSRSTVAEIRAEALDRSGKLISSDELTERGESAFAFGELNGADAVDMYNRYVQCMNERQMDAPGDDARALTVTQEREYVLGLKGAIQEEAKLNARSVRRFTDGLRAIGHKLTEAIESDSSSWPNIRPGYAGLTTTALAHLLESEAAVRQVSPCLRTVLATLHERLAEANATKREVDTELVEYKASVSSLADILRAARRLRARIEELLAIYSQLPSGLDQIAAEPLWNIDNCEGEFIWTPNIKNEVRSRLTGRRPWDQWIASGVRWLQRSWGPA